VFNCEGQGVEGTPFDQKVLGGTQFFQVGRERLGEGSPHFGKARKFGGFKGPRERGENVLVGAGFTGRHNIGEGKLWSKEKIFLKCAERVPKKPRENHCYGG